MIADKVLESGIPFACFINEEVEGRQQEVYATLDHCLFGLEGFANEIYLARSKEDKSRFQIWRVKDVNNFFEVLFDGYIFVGVDGVPQFNSVVLQKALEGQCQKAADDRSCNKCRNSNTVSSSCYLDS